MGDLWVDTVVPYMFKESPRLKRIKEDNIRMEKESPYNFCDRWCERCPHQKQAHCKVYLNEFEQKITAIAYGREPDDTEIAIKVMESQFQDVEKLIEKHIEENEIEFDDIDDDELELIRKEEEFIENNPLQKTAKQYYKKAYEFLKDTFYKDESENETESVYEFETISWYYTLMPVKLHRALCGFYGSARDDEFGLCDAVAQFAVCKKAIKESVNALRKIKRNFSARNTNILELVALLHNIYSRINVLEESI